MKQILLMHKQIYKCICKTQQGLENIQTWYAAVDDQIDKMAHAEDKLEILKKYYNGYTSTN